MFIIFVLVFKRAMNRNIRLQILPTRGVIKPFFYDACYVSLSETPDLVPLGGSANVRISREDYNHAIAASKPSAMTLWLLDKLFTKETLLQSTLYGTKEFAALDPSRILAIKGKLSKQGITANSIQKYFFSYIFRVFSGVQNSK